MKFSNAQIKFLEESGTVKGDKLVIPRAILEQSAPTRQRTSSEDRAAKFKGVLDTITPDSVTGVRTVSCILLAEAGLPTASIANAAYWSGLGDGSIMAFDAGYKSKHVTRQQGNGYALDVVLTPLTDADKVAHDKRVAKRKATETVATPAADATEGAPVAGTDDAVEGASEGTEGTEGASPEGQ